MHHTRIDNPLFKLLFCVARCHALQRGTEIALQRESVSALGLISPSWYFMARDAIATGSVGHDAQAFRGVYRLTLGAYTR